MGLRYGQGMMNEFDQVFHLEQARNESKLNQGIERSASSHVMEYYTPKSLRRVLEYMAIDYVMLKLPIPEWAEQILEQDSMDTVQVASLLQ